MTVSRQGDLRANQKARTRAALVEAAGDLIRQGATPTVAEAAEAARVSRATAYRYFPTQEALLLEVSAVGLAAAPVEEVLAGLDTDDPRERLRAVHDSFHPIALEHEVSLRTALRVYLDTWLEATRRSEDPPSVREGRRMRWIDTVLAPVRSQLTDAQHRRLRSALALTIGMDALVVMKDVCHLGDAEARAVLQWTAEAVLQAGLTEASLTDASLTDAGLSDTGLTDAGLTEADIAGGGLADAGGRTAPPSRGSAEVGRRRRPSRP
jgi:AcrR family transcriptional regulator